MIIIDKENKSYIIETKILNESGLIDDFTVYFMYRRLCIRSEIKTIHKLIDYKIPLEDLKKAIAFYFNAIQCDIKIDYSSVIKSETVIHSLNKALFYMADYLNCDERYIVYNQINKYFIDYYRNCKKSTLLIYGGLSAYINRKIGDSK